MTARGVPAPSPVPPSPPPPPRPDRSTARVLAALSDDTRRSVLDELALRGEASATRASEGLPVSRQAVAKHLSILETAGLVESRRRGREVLYRVRPERLEAVAEWLSSLASSWDTRLRAIKEIAERGGSDSPRARGRESAEAVGGGAGPRRGGGTA